MAREVPRRRGGVAGGGGEEDDDERAESAEPNSGEFTPDPAQTADPHHATGTSSDIAESTPIPRSEGATPRSTAALPSAAIIAPLSVQ